MNNKKIGIITHYDVHNHGAQMQLYALTMVLRNAGNEVAALTFHKNCDFMSEEFFDNYSISLGMVPRLVTYLKKNGVVRAIYNYRKNRTLLEFRRQNKLEGEFYSRACNLDMVVIGSDEVFSIEAGLNPFFFGMGVPCDKVVSYAASFGPTTEKFIYDHRASEFITAGCNHINSISVRDMNTQKLVENFSKKEATLVCDPVILYDFSKERESIFDPQHKYGKYCIVYAYDTNMNDADTIKAIRKYAAQNKLKIISVGNYHKWCDENINLSPLEILSWFSHASMVFTDTFHGTVFSIINSAPFYSKVGINTNKLQFLLDQFELGNRRVVSFSEVNTDQSTINYDRVNEMIYSIRKESMRFLMNNI